LTGSECSMESALLVSNIIQIILVVVNNVIMHIDVKDAEDRRSIRRVIPGGDELVFYILKLAIRAVDFSKTHDLEASVRGAKQDSLQKTLLYIAAIDDSSGNLRTQMTESYV